MHNTRTHTTQATQTTTEMLGPEMLGIISGKFGHVWKAVYKLFYHMKDMHLKLRVKYIQIIM